MSHVACRVYDDYAHHPTEIKASLAAFREKFPTSQIVCVFQPHQAKRLKALFREFQSAFDAADITLIMPTYEVAGRDKRTSKNAEALVRAMQKRHPKQRVFYLNNPKNLKAILGRMLRVHGPCGSAFSLRKSVVVVMMGAGDIVQYTDRLVS